MPDAFDRLIDRVPLSPRTEEPEPGTIVVKLDRVSTTGNRAHARVFFDDRPVARLNVSKPVANLPVKSGEHRVSIRYGREDAGPLLVVVGPGERVEVICGQKEPWTRLNMRTVIRILFLPMVCVGFAAVVWVGHPLLSSALAIAVDGFDLPAGLASFLRRQSPGRVTATIFAFPIVYIAGLMVILIWRSRDVRKFRAEHGSGIYLAIHA